MLALLLCQCEHFFGSAFVFNPARWVTSDGYVPARVLAVAVLALQAVRAGEILELATTTLLPHQGLGNQREIIAALRAKTRRN